MTTHPRSTAVQAAAIPFTPALRWDHSPVEMLEARVQAAAGSLPDGAVLSAITDAFAFAFTSVTLVWIVQKVTREDADALIEKFEALRTA